MGQKLWVGSRIPEVILPSNSGEQINLGKLSGRYILFFMPGPSHPTDPKVAEVQSAWNAVSGAQGCTAHCDAVQEALARFAKARIRVFVVTRQPVAVQSEIARARGWLLQFLSDSTGILDEALGVPTFEHADTRYFRRSTVIVRDHVVTMIVNSTHEYRDHMMTALGAARTGDVVVES